jgi:Uma2 family endonuclease
MDTQTLAAAVHEPLAVPTDRLFPISLKVYEGMVKHRLLTEDDKVELLDGLLVEKMTKGNPHITATYLVWGSLHGLALEGWHARKEDPIALPAGPTGRDSAPEPDIALVRGAIRDYRSRKPVAADIAIVVEVVETSVRMDRAKLASYAWAGIPVAWIVDLKKSTVEVYAKPSGPVKLATYQESQTYGPGDRVPVVVEGREVGQIAVEDLLP